MSPLPTNTAPTPTATNPARVRSGGREATGSAPSGPVEDDHVGHLEPRIVLDPIVHLQTGAEVGAEALSRFEADGDTAAVFRKAHDRGVGIDLELRCLSLIIDHLMATDGASPGFVGVNLSTAALADPRCWSLLLHHRCDRLVVELTDQGVADDLARLRRSIDQLRDLEIRIALHVAGTVDTRAFSVIRPEMAKLWASRWHDGAADDSTLARFLSGCGVFVVAVGVDRPDDIEALHAHGVDAAQGRVYGLPRRARV